MKFKVKMSHLPDKVKSLKPYSTAQEKEALIAPDEISSLEMLAILSDVKADTEAEAIYLLMKLREISVSDILEGMIECTKCKTLNQFQVELDQDMDLNECVPIGVFESSDSVIDTDDMSILDVNKLEEKIQENNKMLLDFNREIPCRVCSKPIQIPINPRSILSNTTLSNIFQEYFLFGKYLHYSNRDVDHLRPYERSILFKILKKDVETAPVIPKM